MPQPGFSVEKEENTKSNRSRSSTQENGRLLRATLAKYILPIKLASYNHNFKVLKTICLTKSTPSYIITQPGVYSAFITALKKEILGPTCTLQLLWQCTVAGLLAIATQLTLPLWQNNRFSFFQINQQRQNFQPAHKTNVSLLVNID